jgi:hypothetical protein
MKESCVALLSSSSSPYFDSHTNLNGSYTTTNSANSIHGSSSSGRLSGRKSASPTVFHFNSDLGVAALSGDGGVSLKKSTTVHNLQNELDDDDEDDNTAINGVQSLESTADNNSLRQPAASTTRSKSLSPSLRRAFQHPRLRHKNQPKNQPPNTPNATTDNSASKCFFFQPINPPCETTAENATANNHDNNSGNKRKAMSFDQASLTVAAATAAVVKKPLARLASDTPSDNTALRVEEETLQFNNSADESSSISNSISADQSGSDENKNLIQFVRFC